MNSQQEDIEYFKEIAGDLLIKLGYEDNLRLVSEMIV